MEEDESEMRQKEGNRVRANSKERMKAKSSADCWFVE